METQSQNTVPSNANTVVRRARRGFAAISPERQREIARKGGVAAHRAGTAHEFTPEEARAAGRKGGLAARRRRPNATDST
jgi:general stress protein YciG